MKTMQGAVNNVYREEVDKKSEMEFNTNVPSFVRTRSQPSLKSSSHVLYEKASHD